MTDSEPPPTPGPNEWGLEVSILPTSWYNIGSTVHVVFYPPERYR